MIYCILLFTPSTATASETEQRAGRDREGVWFGFVSFLNCTYQVMDSYIFPKDNINYKGSLNIAEDRAAE